MLGSNQEKEMTRAEALKKVEAYKTLNTVLVQANSKFMDSLARMLTEKQATHEALKIKLEKGEGTESENAEYIFLGGYIQCLKDVLNVRS